MSYINLASLLLEIKNYEYKNCLVGTTGFKRAKPCIKLIERGDEITILSGNAIMANSILPEAKNYKRIAE